MKAAEAHLNSAHNKGGHDIVWNKQFGIRTKRKLKSLAGYIVNAAIANGHGRTDNNFARTIYQPMTQPFTPPSWVLQQEPFSQPTQNSKSSTKPKYRLEGKQSLSPSRLLHVNV